MQIAKHIIDILKKLRGSPTKSDIAARVTALELQNTSLRLEVVLLRPLAEVGRAAIPVYDLLFFESAPEGQNSAEWNYSIDAIDEESAKRLCANLNDLGAAIRKLKQEAE